MYIATASYPVPRVQRYSLHLQRVALSVSRLTSALTSGLSGRTRSRRTGARGESPDAVAVEPEGNHRTPERATPTANATERENWSLALRGALAARGPRARSEKCTPIVIHQTDRERPLRHTREHDTQAIGEYTCDTSQQFCTVSRNNHTARATDLQTRRTPYIDPHSMGTVQPHPQCSQSSRTTVQGRNAPTAYATPPTALITCRPCYTATAVASRCSFTQVRCYARMCACASNHVPTSSSDALSRLLAACARHDAHGTRPVV